MTAAVRAQPPAALIDAARSGEPAAIADLLALCQPDIRRYARRTCRADMIDDAAQDAMLILLRRIGALKAVAAFSSWLFEIVKRECLRQARLAARLTGLGDRMETAPADPAFWSRPPAELRLDMAAALQSLPEHYRAVVLMRDVEERTIDEIAAALGLTREAVKARLHRARALVREYLKA